MDDRYYIYGTAATIAAYFLWQVLSRRFDPFAPTWLYFVGYVQVYIIQAHSYHDWGVGIRGAEVVETANARALWALLWFLAVYHLGPARMLARRLPEAPRTWPTLPVAAASPVLIVWGLFCAGVFGGGIAEDGISAEGVLLLSFPFVMMVAAILLIVTGRRADDPKPGFTIAGLGVAGAYMLIWMLNGKRSHSLMAVLTTVCAMYVTRLKRPSWAVLGMTALTGALAVAISIGWRNAHTYDRDLGGFIQFVAEFDPSTILVSMDLADEGNADDEYFSYETKEYGGYLLMLDTVPEKSGYDYGANYIRTFSTFIPRIVWGDKPIYGRQKWIDAWIAGSEFKREDPFSGPAIGILGATQLNGGALGTLIVIGVAALILRTLYDFFLMYADRAWAQFSWSIFFYNAWFMVVNDDPRIWFSYNWGFAAFPIVVMTFLAGRFSGPGAASPAADHPDLARPPAAFGAAR